MSAARSPIAMAQARQASRSAHGGTFFSTRSASSLPHCRASCSACCRSGSSSGSAERGRSGWTCGRSAATNREPRREELPPAVSGRISIIGSNVVSDRTPPLRERREDVPRTRPSTSPHGLAAKGRPARASLASRASACLNATIGPATSASSRTRSSARSCSASADRSGSRICRTSFSRRRPVERRIAGQHSWRRARRQEARHRRGISQVARKLYRDGAILGVHPNYLHRLIRNLGIKARARGGAVVVRLPPGTVLGRYQVLELDRAGGMGEVYRARDTRLGPRPSRSRPSPLPTGTTRDLRRASTRAAGRRRPGSPAHLRVLRRRPSGGHRVPGDGVSRRRVAGGAAGTRARSDRRRVAARRSKLPMRSRTRTSTA